MKKLYNKAKEKVINVMGIDDKESEDKKMEIDCEHE